MLNRPVAVAPPGPERPSCARSAVELWVLLSVFAALQIGAVAVRALLGRPHDERWFEMGLNTVAGFVLLTAVVTMVRVQRHPLASIGWRTDYPLLDVMIGIGLFLFMTAALIALSVGMYLLAPDVHERMQQTQENIAATIPKMPPGLLVLMSAWVAVFEETVFRGFLLTRLRAMVGWWPAAVVLGAALFAPGHWYQGAIGVGFTFVLGILLGGIFAWRKSLVPVIILHFLLNTVQLLVMYEGRPDWK